MDYKDMIPGIFLRRPNRFIAHVEIRGKEEICHVKNTGRCRELLQPGTQVWCQKFDSPTRKTKFDLITVRKGDAGDFMMELAATGGSADVVFTEPPRAGCSRQFLASLVTLNPEKIVYISCNPETQARDFQYLTQNGYRVKKIQPVDMFPYTRHIETVALLCRGEVN